VTFSSARMDCVVVPTLMVRRRSRRLAAVQTQPIRFRRHRLQCCADSSKRVIAESEAGSLLELSTRARLHRASARPQRDSSLRGAVIEFRDHLRTAGGALKNWAIAQVQDSLAVGVLWLIGLYVLHVPLAALWAVLAALLQIVPHLGPILGLLGPIVSATIGWRDWQHPAGVLALYAVIAVLDGLLLQPYIMRRTARIPIWASVLAPIVLGIVWPFWGVLVAAPLLAILYAYKERHVK
jgi:predicted PurR-regulated permease PerM